MGRFLAVDPTGRSVEPLFPQTFNRYSYSRNNPVNRLDPDGEADVTSEAASAIFGVFPGAGEFQDGMIAFTGYDPITSERQSTGTRVLSGVALFAPFVGAKTVKNAFDGAVAGVRRVAGSVGRFIASRRVSKAIDAISGIRGADTWGQAGTLGDHFARHGSGVGARSPEGYAQQASDFLKSSKEKGLPTKVDSDGTIRVYDPEQNIFGAYNADGTTKTFFKPDSDTYFERQPGRSVN